MVNHALGHTVIQPNTSLLCIQSVRDSTGKYKKIQIDQKMT